MDPFEDSVVVAKFDVASLCMVVAFLRLAIA
jgi:hypothetical protein